MQDLLKDYLVEHIGKEGRQYSLTCAVCGACWISSTTQNFKNKSCDLKARGLAGEEAKEYHRMCTFCGRPVCLKCFEDVEGIFLCAQCGKRLRERINIK